MPNNLIALQDKRLGHRQTVYEALSDLVDRQGSVTVDDIDRLAAEYHLPKAQLRCTAEYYDSLKVQDSLRHRIRLCNGQPCRNAGEARVRETLCRDLGINAATGQDAARRVKLEPVACLGYCGNGPNAMVDGKPVSLNTPLDMQRVLQSVSDDRQSLPPVPVNAVYPPAAGEPSVILHRWREPIAEFAAARRHGSYETLRSALQGDPVAVVEGVKRSRLRGRGGAGYPTGLKLEAVAGAAPAPDGDTGKYIVCNADEGDCGAYIDKEILERDPHLVLEGMALAGYAAGANAGIIYLREEYPRAFEILKKTIAEAERQGCLGSAVLGSPFAFTVRVVRGRGSYVCGEETALLRSLEGLPGLVTPRPPYPAQQGYRGRPTLVQNVETLANLPWIVRHGGERYAALGFGDSRGTKLVSLNAAVSRPGLYEVEMGTPIRRILFDLAGGMREGLRFQAVQIGGPLGAFLPESLLDTPLGFESLAGVHGTLGHGGMVVYSDRDDLLEATRDILAFCAAESCGQCLPCRIGSARAAEMTDRLLRGGGDLPLLRELLETMRVSSLCGLGGEAGVPLESLLRYFPGVMARRTAATGSRS